MAVLKYILLVLAGILLLVLATEAAQPPVAEDYGKPDRVVELLQEGGSFCRACR